MTKLNRKGFTLIELLAVVVILLAISVIAVSSISAAIERNKDKQDESKLKIIYGYAQLYYEANKNTETDNCIELSKLNLTEEEATKSNGQRFSGVIVHNNGANFNLDTSKSSCP